MLVLWKATRGDHSQPAEGLVLLATERVSFAIITEAAIWRHICLGTTHTHMKNVIGAAEVDMCTINHSRSLRKPSIDRMVDRLKKPELPEHLMRVETGRLL